MYTSFPPPSSPLTPAGGSTTGSTTPAVPLELLSTTVDLVIPASSNTSSQGISLESFYGAVSAALLKQRVQDILDALADPAISAALWLATGQAASDTATMLNAAMDYNFLQGKLNALKLSIDQTNLNQAIQNFNQLYGPQDITQTNALNDKINAFNQASSDYSSALTNYNQAILTYNAAQATYQTALTTYQSALQNYQNGSITESQLRDAETNFNSAKSTFNTAQTSFNNQKSVLDGFSATYLQAKQDLDNQQSIFNAYSNNRHTDAAALNVKIDAWNAKIATARDLITQMNTIRLLFNANPIDLPDALPEAQDLSPFVYPAPQTGDIDDIVRAQIIQSNTDVDTANASISVANSSINTINGNPSFSPKLSTIPNISSTGTIPAVGLYPTIDPVSLPTLSSNASYTPPSQADYLTPTTSHLLPIIISIAQRIEREQLYVSDTENDTSIPLPEKRTLIGGLGASAALSTLETSGDALKSPHLERQLSRQVFEAFFNIYGVPIGSALVDQIGSLKNKFSTLFGLTSAADAQTILGTATIQGNIGMNALNVAASLGNLHQVHTFFTSGELAGAIDRIVTGDSALTFLNEDDKKNLIQSLTQEVGASLLKDSLAQVASDLNAPGLLPQILAQLPDGTEQNSLNSAQNQLFNSVIVSQELGKFSNLSNQQIETIALNALSNDSDLLNQTNRTSIINRILKEMGNAGDVSPDLKEKIDEAINAAQDRLTNEAQRIQKNRLEDFRSAVISELTLLEEDPLHIQSIAGRLALNSVSATQDQLQAAGLSADDARKVALAGFNAAQNHNGNINPLGSFHIERVGSLNELSQLLREKVINALAPVEGFRKAVEVAEDYGNLVFSSSNSATALLAANKNDLKRYELTGTVFEDYRHATEAYLNPQLADDSPLRLGKTLLLTGLAGGLSMQGTTSADNTTGPSANQSKHATSYPGILG